MDNSEEKCYICGESTNNYTRNLMQIVTKYSGTSVYKLIERFLDGDLSGSVGNLIASVICQDCLVKLNDYDAAFTKARIIQKEFMDLLKQNFTIVDEKLQLVDELYFKEEPECSYFNALVELDELSEPTSEHLNEEKTLSGTDNKMVSMKCTTCGANFKSWNEMRQHSHNNVKEEPEEIEFLEEADNFNLTDIEYIDEECLEEDDKGKISTTVTDEHEQLSDDDNFAQDDDNDDMQGEIEKLNEINISKSLSSNQKMCVECNSAFPSLSKLKEHLKEHHPPELGSSHVCDICGVAVKTKSALISHAAKHGRILNYDCTFCGKKFQHKGALARHIPIHTGEKPYQCDVCGKQFIHYSSFHMHQLAHGNIREKKCDICGFMLRSSSHLKRHMRVHSGEKPFACPTCGQKFAQRYNMMTHLKAHQGIYREYSKVYKCPFCNESFQRKVKLQEHLSRLHNTVVDSGLLKPVNRPKKNGSSQQTVEYITVCNESSSIFSS